MAIKIVDERGRLTEKGTAALYKDFEKGKLTPSKLAEKYGISTSGVSQRKRMWKKTIIVS